MTEIRLPAVLALDDDTRIATWAASPEQFEQAARFLDEHPDDPAWADSPEWAAGLAAELRRLAAVALKRPVMTTCDPSRRPDQATQQMSLEVVRRFVTIGSFGAADAVHDLATGAGCPACVITSTTQFMLAVAAALTGNEYVTEDLSGRILALINATQAELDAGSD